MLSVHISTEDQPQLREGYPRNARQRSRGCGRPTLQELQHLRRAEISAHRGWETTCLPTFYCLVLLTSSCCYRSGSGSSCTWCYWHCCDGAFCTSNVISNTMVVLRIIIIILPWISEFLHKMWQRRECERITRKRRSALFNRNFSPSGSTKPAELIPS